MIVSSFTKLLKFAAQGRNHPAREIEIFALRRAEMLLDRDHLLLRDEAMPAAERLRVLARIGVISRHVFAHDRSGVTRDVEAGQEAVLEPHAGNGFGADAVPCSAFRLDKRIEVVELIDRKSTRLNSSHVD